MQSETAISSLAYTDTIPDLSEFSSIIPEDPECEGSVLLVGNPDVGTGTDRSRLTSELPVIRQVLRGGPRFCEVMFRQSFLGTVMLNWIAIAVGSSCIVLGIRAKSLLNDAEIAITNEERGNSTLSIAGRLSVVGLGIAMVVYGVLHFLRR